MTNIPIGPGPNTTNIAAMGQTNDAKLGGPLQFRTQDQGSTTTELLRGKITQLRTAPTERTPSAEQANFRELHTPSTQTLQLIGQLQQRA